MAQIIGMPKLGFDMAEGTLIRWVINEGEQVTKGAVLAEIETDKATVEVQSEYSGVLLQQIVPQGTAVPINDPIAVIGEAGESFDINVLLGKPARGEKPTSAGKPLEQSVPVKNKVEPTPLPESLPIASEVHASPLARSIAAELGLDLRMVRGTGPGGRITKKDIESYQVKATTAGMATAPRAAPVVAHTPPPALFIRETRNLPLPKLRAAIGRRMTESMQQSPHFYVNS